MKHQNITIAYRSTLIFKTNFCTIKNLTPEIKLETLFMKFHAIS